MYTLKIDDIVITCSTADEVNNLLIKLKEKKYKGNFELKLSTNTGGTESKIDELAEIEKTIFSEKPNSSKYPNGIVGVPTIEKKEN